jgi:biopolymer transport protein ExbD
MTVQPQELVVNIGEDGTYMVRGQLLDLTGLEKMIAQAVVDNPIQQTVIVRGDKRVAFQSVVSVLDLCNRLKVPSYRITTEPDDVAKP